MADDSTAEITKALEWALALVKRRHAVLRSVDLKDATTAVQTIQTWARGLKIVLDGPAYPAEDVILGCPNEPAPHLVRFHRLHTEEAKTA